MTVTYLGGHDRQREADGTLYLTAEKEVFFLSTKGRWRVPWSDVVDVSVETGDSHETMTATRVALLGPFALAFKKRTDSALVTVTLADGRDVFFAAPKAGVAALRGQLASLRPYLPPA